MHKLLLLLFVNVLFSFEVPDTSASIGIYAVDIVSGDIVFECNSNKSFIPASCMKLFTTASALRLLGSDARFFTLLEYDGEIDSSGNLHGNLYITGGGDPTLGSSRTKSSLSWQEQIACWRDAIVSAGIKHIEGQIIGDASLWEKAHPEPTWAWEDIGNYYGASASALSFNENSYRLVFQPEKEVGAPATLLRTEPPLLISIKNEVKTGAVGSGDCASIYGITTRLACGTIPAGEEEFVIKGANFAPDKLCAKLLTESFGSCNNNLLPTQSKRTIIHTTLSAPLSEIVYWTNQQSINLYAEHLLKKIGDGTTSKGCEKVIDFWQSMGIDLEGFHMVDGSGLSHKNLVTPKQLVCLLIDMKDDVDFKNSLKEVYGGIFAKSGTMSQVKGYAGYSGNIVFAILINAEANSTKKKVLMDSFFVYLSKS